MSALDDLQTDVTAATTVKESVRTLLHGLYQTFQDLLATNNIAAVQQHTNDLGGKIDGLTDAVIANTPAPAYTPPAGVVSGGTETSGAGDPSSGGAGAGGAAI
jgi:hypothetical protein